MRCPQCMINRNRSKRFDNEKGMRIHMKLRHGSNITPETIRKDLRKMRLFK